MNLNNFEQFLIKKNLKTNILNLNKKAKFLNLTIIQLLFKHLKLCYLKFI